MNSISDALRRLEAAGIPVEWMGACSSEAVLGLEELLGVTLPPTFREFLMTTGGGEIDTSYLSGVADNDPSIQYAGTVWWDTLRCRNEFGLPNYLVVVYFADQEICWCLDSRKPNEAGEFPVVSYSLHFRVVDNPIAPDFGEFLNEFVAGRIEAFEP